MLIYLKYIGKNVPPLIFRVEVLPKKAVLKIDKIYIIGRDPFDQNFRKFRSKTQWIGSVQPEKFRKNWSTF